VEQRDRPAQRSKGDAVIGVGVDDGARIRRGVEPGVNGPFRGRPPVADPGPVEINSDDLLGRKGRMVDAIAAIGRGEDCFEGAPFALDIREQGA